VQWTGRWMPGPMPTSTAYCPRPDPCERSMQTTLVLPSTHRLTVRAVSARSLCRCSRATGAVFGRGRSAGRRTLAERFRFCCRAVRSAGLGPGLVAD
jgi:hypothetical protein